ncbi:hypothetical protein PN36_27080 [Candidatus Thiomargarita nelsonii]|uniref:Uncharacterized protein n=1 Tax=Candidatus Thiomargarita nelsonii TaxID=1003181 RepID=A0A0A6P394_9GAMM|nr:hypothetical protein PN36_27080 [Candidatus Thiomargarita nelsonii]
MADIEFRGLQDGTLNLILRNRFEKEIEQFEPPSDLKSEFKAHYNNGGLGVPPLRCALLYPPYKKKA